MSHFQLDDDSMHTQVEARKAKDPVGSSPLQKPSSLNLLGHHNFIQ
jgi:hypothetical protein